MNVLINQFALVVEYYRWHETKTGVDGGLDLMDFCQAKSQEIWVDCKIQQNQSNI